ncbi:Ohr family peroxiredoxin, partial [Pseudonocardia abyssalis]
MADAIYTAEATSSGGGRDGRVRTSDGIIDQDLKMPPALGGPGGATNPEQLFAAAYATCFHGALRLVAKNKGVTVPDGATVDASVSLAPDDTSFGISAVITAHLPGLDQAQADELVEGA